MHYSITLKAASSWILLQMILKTIYRYLGRIYQAKVV